MGADEELSRRAGQDLDPALEPLRAASTQLGCRAWAVGGYVRDRLLGRPHPDLDIVVEEGQSLELARRFAQLTGSRPPVVFERFGTAQVKLGDRQIEFVSARSESYEPDSRKPEVRPAGLEEDLRRRDFTVNTLIMDFEGNVEDRLGVGLKDLRDGILRTPAGPRETFSDDPLRMLRAARLAAQLGFELAPDLIPAMRQLKERVRPPVLSIERISDELLKMLLTERAGWSVDLLSQAGLLELILPELAACQGVHQGGWHTHDVYGHTLQVIDRSPATPRSRLAALFHDVGKPSTAAPDGSFHGHDQVGAQMALDAMVRLRLPNSEAARVSHLVRLHMRPVYYAAEWTDGAVRRLAADAEDDLWPLLDLARADIAASAYPHPEKLDELAARLHRVLDETPSRFQLPVSGHDIMQELDLSPGEQVGRVKARIRDLLMEGSLEPDRQVVLAYLRAHRSDLTGPPV